MLTEFLTLAKTFLPALGTLAIVVAGLTLINRSLTHQWRDKPDAQFRFQLIMLALTLAGIIAIILALPMGDSTRGQLLSLIGILLSATIALSSTTFMGNIMAGIMLKVIKSARPGDFIIVADLTGRITEMDLLHIEIQTEFRDLVTIPNLYMVTQPMRVVRASGTIISAEVSIGYDVPNTDVCKRLCEAAADAGLSDAFAQVRELGDFSVTYRVAGLLEDVTSLISARSKLRKATLDALHNAGIEIVSPTFMNTRRVEDKGPFIPKGSTRKSAAAEGRAEDVAFDKAEEAASVEQIRKELEKVESELGKLTKLAKDREKERSKGKEKDKDEDKHVDSDSNIREEEPDGQAIEKLEAQKTELRERLKSAEEHKREAELNDG